MIKRCEYFNSTSHYTTYLAAKSFDENRKVKVIKIFTMSRVNKKAFTHTCPKSYDQSSAIRSQFAKAYFMMEDSSADSIRMGENVSAIWRLTEIYAFILQF